jgi:alkanesulfonate monooxygenase SsuD/methylene tetrahydromethanopterin reductase-like flavin-dependent oxidoreductase (luciferase family)
MEYALQVAGTYEHVLDAARFAIDRSLVALALPDHYLLAMSEDEAAATPAPDAFVQLGGLARDTEHLALAMLVSPITFRHPAVLAKMAVTIDRMSGGRFSLGVGTGWLEREHEVFGFPFPGVSERFNMLEEALGYLTAAFDPEHPGFIGDRYRLEPFPIAPAPERPIPLIVGGTGANRTPSLAGRFANEFNVYPGPDIRDRIERFRAAASATGRDPDAIRLSSSGQVHATATEREFDDLMNQRAAEMGTSRQEVDAFFERRQTPRGTYEQVREQLDDLEAAGVERFYLQGLFGRDVTSALLDGLGLG